MLSLGTDFKESYKELNVLGGTYRFNSKYVEVFLYLTIQSNVMSQLEMSLFPISGRWQQRSHLDARSGQESHQCGQRVQANTPKTVQTWKK